VPPLQFVPRMKSRARCADGRNAVVNVALGGSYAPTQNGVWTLHFGFNTDFSPVGDADESFSRVDLYGVTTGVRGTFPGLTAAVGIS